jgi:1-aminocyclopropane-1-carboxylate deaminase/D-cysteine desulfhydrase-like pyridoxal-dependent ACC family enzyme
MTAAAGAVLGLETHLVLSGDRPDHLAGNQLLAAMFGAQLHFTGADPRHWGELEIAREILSDELTAQGAAPFAIPIGGSTPVGAVGYLTAYLELVGQLEHAGVRASAVVTTSSSGGTHAGLVAGRAICRRDGRQAPAVIAIAVARGVASGHPDIARLARDTLAVVGEQTADVLDDDVTTDASWLGDDYGVPTAAGDEAVRWGARRGGWVLDRTYSGKGLSGVVGRAAAGEWRAGDDVVFVHTGGHPAVFAPGGSVTT